jgi:prepilin-type N-terminal cleavage/methylation domain-containing protein
VLNKLLKSRKGVTLVELMVALLVFAILVMAVSAVFTPMLRTYYHAVDFAETNPLLDEIANALLADINQANSINVYCVDCVDCDVCVDCVDCVDCINCDVCADKAKLELHIKRAGYAAYKVTYDFQEIEGWDDGEFLHRTQDNYPSVPVYDPNYYKGLFSRGKTVTVAYDNIVYNAKKNITQFEFEVSIVDVNNPQNPISRTYAANPLCVTS